MPQTHAKKPTSLFGGFFQKKGTSTAAVALPQEQLPVPADATPSPQTKAPEVAAKDYAYVSSWQKAWDEEEEVAREEVVINAEGAMNTLNSIFNAEVETDIEETTEARFVTSEAGERFALALNYGPSTPASPTETTHPPSPSALTEDVDCDQKNPLRFADRLRQRVETSLTQN